jgi:hypothetical protein
MRRSLTLLALLVCFAATAQAQQTQSLTWDFIGLAPAEVAAGTHAVQFNGAAITTAPVCVAKTTAPTGTTCTVPLPALQPTNTASVSLTRGGVTATTTINSITTTAAVSASGPKLTINITINLGS